MTLEAFPRGEVKMIAHLRLMTKLRMNGDISPLPPYAVMAFTGKDLSLPFLV